MSKEQTPRPKNQKSIRRRIFEVGQTAIFGYGMLRGGVAIAEQIQQRNSPLSPQPVAGETVPANIQPGENAQSPRKAPKKHVQIARQRVEPTSYTSSPKGSSQTLDRHTGVLIGDNGNHQAVNALSLNEGGQDLTSEQIKTRNREHQAIHIQTLDSVAQSFGIDTYTQSLLDTTSMKGANVDEIFLVAREQLALAVADRAPEIVSGLNRQELKQLAHLNLSSLEGPMWGSLRIALKGIPDRFIKMYKVALIDASNLFDQGNPERAIGVLQDVVDATNQLTPEQKAQLAILGIMGTTSAVLFAAGTLTHNNKLKLAALAPVLAGVAACSPNVNAVSPTQIATVSTPVLTATPFPEATVTLAPTPIAKTQIAVTPTSEPLTIQTTNTISRESQIAGLGIAAVDGYIHRETYNEVNRSQNCAVEGVERIKIDQLLSPDGKILVATGANLEELFKLKGEAGKKTGVNPLNSNLVIETGPYTFKDSVTGEIAITLQKGVTADGAPGFSVVCQQDGKFMLGMTDSTYKLKALNGKGDMIKPLFQTPQQWAAELGYEGDLSGVASVQVSRDGRIALINAENDVLAQMAWVGGKPTERYIVGMGLTDKNVVYPPVDFLDQLKNETAYLKAFGIKSEQVNITYTDKKNDGSPLISASGLPMILAIDQMTGVPRAVLIKNSKADEVSVWRDITLKDLFNIGDSLVYKKSDNSVVEDSRYHDLLAAQYSTITIAQGNYWKWFERSRGEIDTWSAGDIRAQIAIIKDIQKVNPGVQVRVAPFGTFGENNPDWLKGLVAEDKQALLKQHMQDLFDIYKRAGISPSQYVVVNEPYFQGSGWTRGDVMYDAATGYKYVTQAFKDARSIVGEGPVLIYNDTANNSLVAGKYNFFTALTKKNIDAIVAQGDQNIAVGMQMHLLGNVPVNEEDLIQTMKYYGVPVYITELDVDLSMIPDARKAETLISFYTTVYRAALKSGVCKGISSWNGVDSLSWLVDGKKGGASPTLYNGDYTPKPAYFEVLKELIALQLGS